jgi:pimeloyl-ACP methyl ester carboxylesterase
MLQHGQRYADGSEQLRQILRYGSDSVSTLADVRVRMIVNDATSGTRLRAHDGALLSYTLAVPSNPTDPSRLAVLLRGYDKTQYNWTETQLRLASYGIPSVVLDLRGTGTSTGESTFGVEERRDIHDLIRHIRTAHGLKAQNVALIGRSFGANVALQAAATDPNGSIGVVIAEGLFPRFNDMAERLLPQPERDQMAKRLAARNIPIDSLNPAHWLKQIQDVPILFVWGQIDDYVSERERGVTALCYAPKTDAHRQVMMVAKLHHEIARDPRICSEEEYQSYLSQRDAFLQRYLR